MSPAGAFWGTDYDWRKAEARLNAPAGFGSMAGVQIDLIGGAVLYKRMALLSSMFLRLALGISFLSAVADRFGYWGAIGQRNVAWGDLRVLRHTPRSFRASHTTHAEWTPIAGRDDALTSLEKISLATH